MHKYVNENDIIFELNELKFLASIKIIKALGSDGYFAYNIEEENYCEFALFNFYSSDIDGENVLVHKIIHGYGFLQLNELRHMWFGDKDGYIFYPHLNLIEEFFKELRNLGFTENE